MASPMYDKDYEKRKQEAQELIAAGGCSAIKLWSATDAERLCPKDYIKDVKFEPLEGPVYITEWLDAAKKAVELINRGIFLLEPVSSEPAKESQPDGFLEWLDKEIKLAEVISPDNGAWPRKAKQKYLSLHTQPNPEPSVALIRKDANKVMGQIRKRADLEYQKSMNNNPHGMGVAEGIDWCMRMMDTVPFLFRDKEGFTVLPPAVQQEDGEQEDMTDQQVIEMLKDANASLQSQLYTSQQERATLKQEVLGVKAEAGEYRNALIKIERLGTAVESPGVFESGRGWEVTKNKYAEIAWAARVKYIQQTPTK